ncbi:DUF5316 domain-containing protein [Paenibacillus tarimensis]|uniref:DUF5316 domain-containing protein n=1 Tax=Paenibacillus tarimensis TaxID=416012 RepID=UPI001F22057A|nr:DUF5316 domain-containing protein [Paenibacillus tarimensis]MCF2945714.1 DUF5316 domain-containing protein [Paenibacillus tarimensis]
MVQWLIYAGFACLVVSGFALRGFPSVDREQGQYRTEDPQDRQLKRKIVNWSALLAVIFFLLAGLSAYIGSKL